MLASRILLAAPDLRAVSLHQAFLKHLGYDVTLCGDGLGCAERLRQVRPDLLILALDLPWGRGDGILALMGDGELPLVPVVLLAEQTHAARLTTVARSVVRSLLSWPAPPRLLAQAVRVALSSENVGHVAPEVDAAADEWTPAQTSHLS